MRPAAVQGNPVSDGFGDTIMMSKEILMVADAVSNEKGVSRAVIFEAIESALATATKKLHDSEEIDCRVSVDRDTGEYETFRVWTVVEDEEYLDTLRLRRQSIRERFRTHRYRDLPIPGSQSLHCRVTSW